MRLAESDDSYPRAVEPYLRLYAEQVRLRQTRHAGGCCGNERRRDVAAPRCFRKRSATYAGILGAARN